MVAVTADAKARLHCIACRWMHGRCMSPLAASQKSQKKILSSRFPVTFLLKSMCRGPLMRQFAENGSICRLCLFSICSLFFPFRQQRKIRSSFKFALLQNLPLLVVSYHANHFSRFNKCVSIQSVLPFRLPAVSYQHRHHHMT